MRKTRIFSLIIVTMMILGTMTTTVFAQNDVAEVGGTTYASLSEAISAATEGETVVLLTDVETASRITIEKSITLDGGNNTLTVTNDSRVIEIPKTSNNANVTIKNITVTKKESNGWFERGINYNTGGTLVLENVTVAGAPTYAVNFPGSSNNATVIIKDCDLTGLNTVNIWGENMQINITNTDIKSVDSSDSEDYGAIVLNCNASTVANGTVVNVSGGSIIAFNQKGEPSHVVVNASSTGVVNISETTTVNGDVKNQIAIIGDYTASDFEGAFAVATKNNLPIVLIRDVEVNEIIKTPAGKDVVIDLNGFTVTGSAKKTFEVYANATFKNGTIKNVHTNKEGRCIDTRTGGITLALEDVSLFANTKGYNQQVLNIGGDATDKGNIKVNISNSTITASNSGYGIMTFNPVDMTITNTEISGYAALYFKAASGSMGSNGSVVNVVNSDLNSSYHDYENFGTIVFEDINIDVTVDAASSITTEGNAVLFVEENATENDVALNGAVTAGKVVDGWKEGATVSSTNSNVIDALKNEGFAVSDGVVEGKIATATDSGFYMMGENKLGLMRYLFSFGIEGTITNAGVKFINGDKLADNIAGEVSGNANTFFADIVEVPENTEGKYYAVGFVTIGEETYWSNPIFCEPDFTRHFSSLDNGGAK